MLETLKNGLGMWLACGVMIVVVLVQSVLYFRAAWQESKRLEMPKKRITDGIRSAAYTTVGPACGNAIILVSLIALLGAPTGWMRLCDIGAGRAEIAVADIAKGAMTIAEGAPMYEEYAFTFSLWGQAFNNVAWLVIALFCTKSLGKMVDTFNTKFNPKVVKGAMAASVIGMFTYMVLSNSYGKENYYLIAAVLSGITILILNKFFAKHQKLQEFALGIAMLVGILGANALRHLAM